MQTPDPQKAVQIRHDRQGRRAREFYASAVAPGRRERPGSDVDADPFGMADLEGKDQQPQPTDAARRRSPFGSNRDGAGTRQLTRIAATTLQHHTHLQQSCPCLHVDT
jgi:hypothetical protein